MEHPKAANFRFYSLILFCCSCSTNIQATTTGLLDRVLAVVGDKPILLSDLQQRKQDFHSSKTLASMSGLNVITDSSLLKLMIEERLLEHAAEQAGSPVSSSDVDTQIEKISSQNGLSVEQLKISLSKEGVPFAGYRQHLRYQLLKRGVFDRELRRAGGVSEADLKELYFREAPEYVELWLETFPRHQPDKAKLLLEKFSDAGVVNSYKKDHESLGYIEISSLDPQLAKSISSQNNKSSHLVQTQQGQWVVAIVGNKKRGTEEGFIKSKDRLLERAQTEQMQTSFNQWIAQKKAELHIVENN